MSQCPTQYHPAPTEEQERRGEEWRRFVDEVMRLRDERTPTFVMELEDRDGE